jgi:plastocyanin
MLTRLFRAVAACLLVGTSAPAVAGVLTVAVTTDAGRPVPGAVVTLRPVQGTPPSPRIAGPFRVEQRNLQFNPFVSIVPVNADVAFPNFDPTMHHVYSFSPAKVFELRLIARNQSRSVRLDKPGLVAVGCNIHDSMAAYIYVTDTAWTVRTDAAGRAVFRDVPPGAVTATVWHPYLRAPGSTASRRVALAGVAQTESFSVRLRPAPVRGAGAY